MLVKGGPGGCMENTSSSADIGDLFQELYSQLYGLWYFMFQMVIDFRWLMHYTDHAVMTTWLLNFRKMKYFIDYPHNDIRRFFVFRWMMQYAAVVIIIMTSWLVGLRWLMHWADDTSMAIWLFCFRRMKQFTSLWRQDVNFRWIMNCYDCIS